MGTLPDVPLVRLEGYQGPLDLLLALIRRQQINIYDIPIARITEQYLEYLHALEKMNVDTAGEFVLMAATLIQIKSRMLLPHDPAVGPASRKTPGVNWWTDCWSTNDSKRLPRCSSPGWCLRTVCGPRLEATSYNQRKRKSAPQMSHPCSILSESSVAF